MNSKNDIRNQAKKFRDQLVVSPDAVIEATKLFMDVVPFNSASIVSAYYPIGSEIDPSPIVEALWQRGIQTCLPRIIGGERGLKFAEWNRQTKLVTAKFGTVEPDENSRELTPNIVIVPLLAFDQTGNRMGYGQGHYDETLRQLREKGDVLAIGLAYAEQAVLLALPTEPHDQKLDMVITPQRIFDFRP